VHIWFRVLWWYNRTNMGGIKRFFGSRIVIVFLAVIVLEIVTVFLIQTGRFDFILNKNSLNNPKFKEINGTIYNDLSQIEKNTTSWVEAKIDWQDLEPGLDKYDWSVIDNIVQKSGNRAILLTIKIKHDRLTLCAESEKKECPPRNEQEFINFISSLFEHTYGKVLFFQIGDQLGKENWQEDWKNYLSLIKKIDAIKGARIIVSSQIPLSSWQDNDKFLVSGIGFQVIKIKADKSSAEVAENIVKFKKALKEKANSLPVWSSLDHSEVVLAQTDNLNIEALKKSILLLSNEVEKIFFQQEVLAKVDDLSLFSKMSSVNIVNFGDKKVEAYEIISKNYSKPIYLVWFENNNLNITLNIDPAYYNFYDFKGGKVELEGKKISADSNGLLMLPI